MTADEAKKLLALIREYGDMKFRAGALSAFADRRQAQERTDEADKLLKEIERALREATK